MVLEDTLQGCKLYRTLPSQPVVQKNARIIRQAAEEAEAAAQARAAARHTSAMQRFAKAVNKVTPHRATVWHDRNAQMLGVVI